MAAEHRPALPELPVSAVLPDLSHALVSNGQAVLVAPPGAGKTTLVPLHLLDALWALPGKIILLEPRRLAARAAARRMAALLGEDVGETVGYAMRMESRQSARTRILVVTEGIFARMALDDPELSGVSAVIFDEFHERSLDGDFGLALALDIRRGLREDLRLLVMSATLDGARVARLLEGAPVIESEGRAYPVEIRHAPRDPGGRIEEAMAAAIRAALASGTGSILAFLPGQGEITRTAALLEARLPVDVRLAPLYGAMEGRAQDEAIRTPAPGTRKVVLATSIAETSITIDGVDTVIDSGLARVPKFEPSTGLTRLETVRVSRAAAGQRAGRAGRTAPGTAIRLWHEGQTAALAPYAQPEILEADLTGLLLDCAAFGVADPASLAFLDPPPFAALAEARRLLEALGALDATGRITLEGRAMRGLALPVRLSHMLVRAAALGAAEQAARIAVLLTERGLGGISVDLERRLEAFGRERGPRSDAARKLAASLARQAVRNAAPAAADPPEPGAGALLLHAYPDRLAKARGARGRFVLANGRGGMVDETDPLAAAPFLVVADMTGSAQNARIVAAAALDEETLRNAMDGRIERTVQSRFDAATGALRARAVERIGGIVLTERTLPVPSGPEAEDAMIEAIRAAGIAVLPFGKEAGALRQKLGWLHQTLGEPWPDVSDDALSAALEDWLRPFMAGQASLAALKTVLHDALLSRVPWDLQRRIGDLAPGHFEAPTGNRLPIRYEENGPVLAIRVQELFGLKEHPAIAGGKVPLLLELLSPAHRPIQTTRDLPGFWAGSWADVRADMRGRYPKHPWPEDPANAPPTARAKPRS
ncbi:MAG: ATP-dependent helicase HrpB [Notoacmeibacter sp.]|nr:ATP-dependent helicase HrpB [Notoacmeibacter sp.]MCC0032368.1 ATP-dependent helicase HrpB [Brucellaceae bacterium]